MGSKSKYKDKNTIREIRKMREGFPGETIVIYFVDCDRMDIDAPIRSMNERSLRAEAPKPKQSNMLAVLDKYFERAEDDKRM